MKGHIPQAPRLEDLMSSLELKEEEKENGDEDDDDVESILALTETTIDGLERE